MWLDGIVVGEDGPVVPTRLAQPVGAELAHPHAVAEPAPAREGEPVGRAVDAAPGAAKQARPDRQAELRGPHADALALAVEQLQPDDPPAGHGLDGLDPLDGPEALEDAGSWPAASASAPCG